MSINVVKKRAIFLGYEKVSNGNILIRLNDGTMGIIQKIGKYATDPETLNYIQVCPGGKVIVPEITISLSTIKTGYLDFVPRTHSVIKMPKDMLMKYRQSAIEAGYCDLLKLS